MPRPCLSHFYRNPGQVTSPKKSRQSGNNLRSDKIRKNKLKFPTIGKRTSINSLFSLQNPESSSIVESIQRPHSILEHSIRNPLHKSSSIVFPCTVQSLLEVQHSKFPWEDKEYVHDAIVLCIYRSDSKKVSHDAMKAESVGTE